MPLARLENFLKNLNGNTLYVDPNELDASDSIENKGNSRLRPFKTIQRALIEAARFAYIPGPNNDLFDQTSILISPGTHFIDNRPGYYVNSAGVLKDAAGATKTISEFNISTNFDITDPANQLHVFNSHTGGVIVPKGTSLIANDLRKTKIKPKFVPNPIDDNIVPAAIFQLTGACYIYGFTIFDGDPIGKVYNNYTTNTVVPNYSHHKLTAFEYADNRNNIIKSGVDTGYTDLKNYYYKVSLAYGAQSSRSVIDGFLNLQPNVDENRIVGELGEGFIAITNAISGNGVSGTSVITIETQTPHGLSPLTPFLMSGLGQNEGPTSELEYNGNFIVAQVVSETEFTYLLSNVPTQTLNPSVSGAQFKIISDTVSSASPYVFNMSLKSVYGMNGLHADGSRVTGFKSMVTAQFTGISLQKDDRAFTEYDSTSGSYKFQDNFGLDKFLHQSSLARYRPSFETFHIKASNDSYIQAVSIFAIGYAKQFVTDSGGDQSITNSNSNFGSIALFATGFKKDVLAKDNFGFITHIIPPKDISQLESAIRFVDIDGTLTTSLAASNQKTRVYLKDYIDLLDPPSSKIRGYTVGAKQNDTIAFKKTSVDSSIPINPTNKLEFNITNIDTTTNIITFSSVSGISTGISGKIISTNGLLPDGISNNTLYNLRLTGGTGIKLYENQLNSEFDISVVDIKNQVGVTTNNLKFVSRISEKNSGDIGSPIQYDSINKNWYVGVNSIGLGATSFFSNLATTDVIGSSIFRKNDIRISDDRTYRVRLVIPKESENASDPTPGFIIQRASNELNSLLFQSASTELISATNNELSQVRNKGAIIDAWYDTGTVNVITSVPHGLKVGNKIEIYNLKSSAEPAPVGLGTGTGFNGNFIVTSIVNEIRFTYTITRNPGTISQGTSSFQSWLSIRDCAQTSGYRIPPYTIYDANRDILPYFVCKEVQNDYQVYDIEEIQNYIKDTSDGIYHATLNVFKNIPDAIPFNISDYKLSQSIERLYPEQDIDNPSSDPEAAKTVASKQQLGDVIVNDIKNSVTKETLISYLKDYDIGKVITGITTYYDAAIPGGAGISTATTQIDHGIGGVRQLSISAVGSGYVNGTYYDIPLCGGTGSNATANITISGGIVTSASIRNFGSGYTVGDSLTLRGIPGSTTASTVTVSSLLYSASDTDTIQILGASKPQNNGTFIIKSVTSNKITYYNNLSTPEVPNDAVALLAGIGYQIRSAPDGSVYNSGTNLTTITTQNPHTFAIGNKVIFDDQIGTPVNQIGISTIVSVSGITTFTVRGNAEDAVRVFGVGLTPSLKDTTPENENVTSRHYAIYGGYKSKLNQAITQNTNNFLVANNFGLLKGDFIQVNSEIMLVTKVSGGEIFVKRGLFGSRAISHDNEAGIQRIKINPVELRRNSIIRASGHTFEYTGFGPGNYSTGMPTNQDRTLSDSEILISQSLASRGGLVVYTGMNSNGEFFIGRVKFDAVTGKQIEVSSPIIESSSAETLDSLVANRATINTELDGSTALARFNKLIVNSDASFTGITTIDNSTSSINQSTGALVITGGVGIGEKLNVFDSAQIDKVTVGLTSATTINTTEANLYLNSFGGTVVVNDDLRTSGNSTLAGALGVTGIATFSSSVQATTFIGAGTIPVGGIIMWSGSVASIPTGWALCNGANATPDLRDRFVVGAGSGYAVAAIGGTADAVVPEHNHSATFSGGTAVSSVAGTNSYGGGSGFAVNAGFSGAIGGSVSIANAGVSGVNQNLPPYYAIAFIMRTV